VTDSTGKRQTGLIFKLSRYQLFCRLENMMRFARFQR
jgi:hypothetical protein